MFAMGMTFETGKEFRRMAESLPSHSAGASLDIEIPEVLREPTQAKNWLFLILYMLANMAFGIGNITTASLLLAEHIGTFVSGSQQTTLFSLILAGGSVFAVLTNPIVGMLSDRTASRWGRRRPWYVAGAILTVLNLLVMAYAPSLLVVAVGYIVLQVPINMLHVALAAIMPDQIPVRQRATISALAAGPAILLGGLFGQILVAQIFKTIPTAYISLAISIAIMATLFLFVLREPPLPQKHTQPLRMKQVSGMLSPLLHRDFALVWVARCLIFLGYTTVVTYMFYYLQDAVHYTQMFPGQTTAQGVSLFFATNTIAIILASVVGGIVSDKLMRRKSFVIGASFLIMAGLLLYAFFPIWTMVLVATGVIATGMGVFFAVDLALASQVLPEVADRGKDMGIVMIATYVPIVISPLVAGLALGLLHSYLTLFVILSVAALVAAVLILPIKSVR
jgi:MFS family permease